MARLQLILFHVLIYFTYTNWMLPQAPIVIQFFGLNSQNFDIPILILGLSFLKFQYNSFKFIKRSDYFNKNMWYYLHLSHTNQYIRPCKLNYLFLIPVRANFLSPSGYILCIAVEYLISDNNPRRIYIVAIVFFKVSSCYYGTITLLWTQ